MKSTTQYLSSYFLETIWPAFYATFQNKNSKNMYFSDICQFSTIIEKDICDVTREDCIYYVSELEKLKQSQKIAQSTLVKKVKEMSGLLHFMEENDTFTLDKNFRNFFTTIPVSRVKEEIHYNKIISLAELDKLIGYLKEADPLILLAVLLSFKTLLKTNEILNLRIEDFVIDRNHTAAVRIVTQSDDVRYNKLTDDIYEILESYLEQIPEGHEYLFSKHGDAPFSVHTLNRRLVAAFHAVHVKPYTYNSLRNTGITFSVSNGADVNVVAKAMGMKTKGHITRLSSLLVDINDTSEYVNVTVKKGKVDKRQRAKTEE